MKRIAAILLAALLMIGIFAGCGGKTETAPAATDAPNATEAPKATEAPQTTEAPAPTEEPAPAGPRTITDVLGRSVEIPSEVNEIVGLSSAARFIVYAGAADKVVGLSELEIKGDPGMPFAYAAHDVFANCAAVSSGGSGDTVYTEELVVLDPEVIIMLTSEAAKADELQAQLEIPVVAITANGFTDKKFQDSLMVIGEVAGTADHAETVCKAIQGWIDDMNARTKDIPEEDKPTVYNGGMGFRGPHGFEGTSAKYPPFMAINAKNVADEADEKGAFLVDLEQVTVWDPDIIFLNPSNMYLVNEDYAKNAAFYDNLRAVKEGKLYSQVNFNYFSTNMELAIADAYYAGTIIYPEHFADVDFNTKAEEIFNTMIGMDYLRVLDDNGIGFGQMTIGE